jgi:type IV pilus assembly protein PilB
LSATPTIGQLLLEEGRISPLQLDEALAEQDRTRMRVGEILCRRGDITVDDLCRILARKYGHGTFVPTRDAVDQAALDLIPLHFARRHRMLPIRADEQTLVIAMSDPTDVETLDAVGRIAAAGRRALEILLASEQTIERSREAAYRKIEGSRSVDRLIDQVVLEMGDGTGEAANSGEGTQDARLQAQDAAIIQLIDEIIEQALQERATDIHLEPHENDLLIRFRVDGFLHDALRPPSSLFPGAVCRLKILSDMDIAETRAAQDGRFTHRMNGRDVDVRVSAVPTIWGEKIVLRLLDKSGFDFNLGGLGFEPEEATELRRAIQLPYGIVLLSGPTGSGKSTTLYAGLLEVPRENLNVMTIEDPVEYRIDRLNQVQVNERKRLSFAQALRSFLRQDPDVIMVGEIRDRETADLAVRASLTGHLVLSTIHANDAPTTATRLISMGVEPFMAASALSLIAAQRLVRRVCRHCRVPDPPDERLLLSMGLVGRGVEEKGFVRGMGCPACRGRGYIGRTAITEMLRVSGTIREAIAEGRPSAVISTIARREGMRTLRESGIRKAQSGETTLEEVLRVCISDESQGD